MAEVGFARFSAREVAKRIGYSVGTLYNVFGTYDRLILAINTRTFELWTEHLRQRLENAGEDRIRALVEGYFSFARDNTNLWMAIYDHHLPSDAVMPDDFGAIRGKLTELVEQEVAAALPEGKREMAPRLARSLIASVHGHCAFALNGTFSLMGVEEPMKLAVARAREAIAASH
ncbi:TetR/AcrR family transcriptional regulator [Allosphingosinicella flava]|nr:TetR/AcrR family transcriptional regulator [Sphingosinicella flava]